MERGNTSYSSYDLNVYVCLLLLAMISCRGASQTVHGRGVRIEKINEHTVKIISKSRSTEISGILNKLIEDTAIHLIMFDDGVFKIEQPIFVKRSNIKFQGAGNTILKASFKSKPVFNVFFLNDNLDTETMLSNIHYANLIFDANNFGFLTLNQFNRVKNFSVVGCKFYKGGQTSIGNQNLPSDWTNAIACSNKSSGIIDHNEIVGMTKTGIYVSVGCNAVKVSNNFIDLQKIGIDRPGIQCLMNSVVENNDIRNCSGAGILAQTIEPTNQLLQLGIDVRPLNIRIKNNHIQNCSNGIEFNHNPDYDERITQLQKSNPRTSNSTIMNNTIINSSFCGIMISNRDSIEIKNNTIYNEPGNGLVSGITIIGSNRIYVHDNIIDNSVQNVFFINKSNDITIQENKAVTSKIIAKFEIELRNDDTSLKSLDYKMNSFKSHSISNIKIKL